MVDVPMPDGRPMIAAHAPQVGERLALLNLAEERARNAGRARLSIIVSDANTGARRLYERKGYSERARRPMVKEDWRSEGRDWVLLLKDLFRGP